MNPAWDRNDAALKKKMKMKGKSQSSAKSCSVGLSARLLKYATDATVDDILDVEYWRALVPFLHVGKMDRQSLDKKQASSKRLNAASTPVGREIFRQQRQKLTEDGYCLAERYENGDERSENLDQVLIDKLAFAASVLEHYGWPTTFLAIYDEAWELAQQCQDWMDMITKAKVHGGEQVRNLFCMDIVGFNVIDGIGFSAHRDRQPEDWQPKGHASEDPKTTFDKGFARYITCWVALSDAHPGNSCLHYVTAKADPGYFKGDSVDGDPMARCFSSNKAAFQSIRACPVKKGGMIAHTHRVIHWGNQGESDEQRMKLDWASEHNSKAVGKDEGGDAASSTPTTLKSRRMHHVGRLISSGEIASISSENVLEHLPTLPANPCRCAISFAFANNRGTSFEPPYLPADLLPFPAFELRAAICSAQILNYSTLALGDPRGWMTLAGRTLKKKHLSKLYNVFKKHDSHFAKHYREEIAGKYVAVSLKAGAGGAGCDAAPASAKGDTAIAHSSKLAEAGAWQRGMDAAAAASGATRRKDSGVVMKRRLEGANEEEEEEGGGWEEEEEEEAGQASSFGTWMGDGSDSELEEDALEAMLIAEQSNQNVLFHDDFDVLAASGAFGAGMDSVLGKLGVAKKKEGSDKAKSGKIKSSHARKKVPGLDCSKSEIKKKKKLKGMGLTYRVAVGTKMKCVKNMKGVKGA